MLREASVNMLMVSHYRPFSSFMVFFSLSSTFSLSLAGVSSLNRVGGRGGFIKSSSRFVSRGSIDFPPMTAEN